MGVCSVPRPLEHVQGSAQVGNKNYEAPHLRLKETTMSEEENQGNRFQGDIDDLFEFDAPFFDEEPDSE